MSNTPIFHAIGLHLHQPPNNLLLLAQEQRWEAQQIIHCYDRATRYAHKYADTARLHVAFSGILLEQLEDPAVVEAYQEFIDIPAMLESYRQAENIELLSTGYYHPIFPLIPSHDWEDQLKLAQEQMQRLFGRAPKGFYPPATMFNVDMVPTLVKAGYEYVVLEAWQLKSLGGEGLDPFRPYFLKHRGKSIAVVAKEMDLSNAQYHGTDPAWFADEARHRTSGDVPPRILNTWSDGENSPWFRNMDEPHGYFGGFFAPYMEHFKGGEYPLQPITISEFIKTNPPQAEASVENPHWQASDSQAYALGRIRALDTRYHGVNQSRATTKLKQLMKEARHRLLASQTSCYLFWNDAWLDKIHANLDKVETLLDEATKKPTQAAASPSAKPTSTVSTAKSVVRPPAQKSPAEKKTVTASQVKATEVTNSKKKALVTPADKPVGGEKKFATPKKLEPQTGPAKDADSKPQTSPTKPAKNGAAQSKPTAKSSPKVTEAKSTTNATPSTSKNTAKKSSASRRSTGSKTTKK